MLCISCHFIPLKPLTLQVDSAKLLDVLTSLTVSHAILPHAVCFATSRPANHAICSFVDASGYASGPIRRCLFIDYIIKRYMTQKNDCYWFVFSIKPIFGRVKETSQRDVSLILQNICYYSQPSL